MIKIELACNGYIVTVEGEDEYSHIMIFEDSDYEDGGIDSATYMLNYILDCISMSGCKHDKRRIRIVVEEQ